MKFSNLKRALSAFWLVLNGGDLPKETIIKKEVPVLSREAYSLIEKRVKQPLLDNNSQALYAGYLMGIQHVLRLIRDDFTKIG